MLPPRRDDQVGNFLIGPSIERGDVGERQVVPTLRLIAQRWPGFVPGFSEGRDRRE